MLNDWGGQVLPHPPGRRPLVGDVLGTDRHKPLQSTMARGASLGPIFELKVFRQKLVFVAGAELGAEMCDESKFGKGHAPAVEALREYVGDGLFTAHADEPNWQLAHDLLVPAFSRPAMQRYHGVMLQAARELFDYWDGSPDSTVDVSRDMTKLTLETISRAAFSRDFGSFDNQEPHKFVLAMIAALRAGQRKGTLASMPGSRFVLRRIDKENAQHVAYVDSLIDEMIASRRADDVIDDRDLLGIMLNAAHPETGERLDDLNIRYQILTFLVAGHETTSGALSFALYYLAREPEVLARAQAETDRILGADRDAEPTFEQVGKMRYLRRVIDESLRLWPTVPAFPRSPREEVTLSTGQRMRPGDWGLVLTAMTHRDPTVWGPDAEEFDPDRFLPERSRGRLPHAYKPFGTGERSCIGRQFALHESVLVLARMLHRYDIRGDDDYELAITERLTLMPRNFRLALVARHPGEVDAGTTPTSPADDTPDAAAPATCPVQHG